MSKATARSINVRLVGPGRVVATDTHEGARLSLLEMKRLARDFLVACYVRQHFARSFGGDEYSDDNMRRAAAATRDREIQVGDCIETEDQWNGLLHRVAALSGRDEVAVLVRFMGLDLTPTV